MPAIGVDDFVFTFAVLLLSSFNPKTRAKQSESVRMAKKVIFFWFMALYIDHSVMLDNSC